MLEEWIKHLEAENEALKRHLVKCDICERECTLEEHKI